MIEQAAFAEAPETARWHPNGDHDALAELAGTARGANGLGDFYARVRKATFAHLYATLGDWHEAEDALQDALLTAVENFENYQPWRGSLAAWIAGIAKKKALYRLRQAGRATPLDPQRLGERLESALEPAVPQHDWLGNVRLRELLGRLSPAQRQVLFMRFALGLPTSDIAALLDRSVGDVHQLQSRALRRLKGPVEAQEGRVVRHPLLARLRESFVLHSRRWALVGA